MESPADNAETTHDHNGVTNGVAYSDSESLNQEDNQDIVSKNENTSKWSVRFSVQNEVLEYEPWQPIDGANE
jgi:hypothetical protein